MLWRLTVSDKRVGSLGILAASIACILLTKKRRPGSTISRAIQQSGIHQKDLHQASPFAGLCLAIPIAHAPTLILSDYSPHCLCPRLPATKHGQTSNLLKQRIQEHLPLLGSLIFIRFALRCLRLQTTTPSAITRLLIAPEGEIGPIVKRRTVDIGGKGNRICCHLLPSSFIVR